MGREGRRWSRFARRNAFELLRDEEDAADRRLVSLLLALTIPSLGFMLLLVLCSIGLAAALLLAADETSALPSRSPALPELLARPADPISQTAPPTPTANQAPPAAPAPLETVPPTPEPSATPTVPPPAPPPSTANTAANLHAQPDPGSPVIAVAQPGQPLAVAGQDGSGQWLQLAGGSWIAAAAVDNVPAGLPVTAQPTPTPAPAGPVANTTATVHEGPSPDSAVVITVQPGQLLVVIGQDGSGQWLQLASGSWIAAAAVDNVPAGLPVTAQQPVAQAPPAFSRSLGLTRSEWEQVHGAPIDNLGTIYQYGAERGIRKDVIFSNDFVRILYWQIDSPVSAGDALSATDLYKPSDAQYVRSYSPEGRPETTVQVYTSAMLAERLGTDPQFWIGGEPGTFIVQYNEYVDHHQLPVGVSQVILSTGNNP